MLRQFIFLVPFVLILPPYMGITGVWMATPLADGIAVLITVIVLIRDRRKNSSSGIAETVIQESDTRKRA
jgi:Na+-driven multidrug efflux pump